MSRFTESLLVSPLPDGKTWVIQKDFGYDVGKEGSDEKIEVPIGFKTDFTSVPRLFWWLIPRWGKYGNAAVIHDFLYWEQKHYNRKQSDQIFLEAMIPLNVKTWQATLIYAAVRIGGMFSWHMNRWRKHKNADAKYVQPAECDRYKLTFCTLDSIPPSGLPPAAKAA